MKTIMLLCFLSASLIVNAQSITDKAAIKSVMDKVNSYQLTNLSKDTDYNWVRGTYYTGVMASYQSTGDKKYLEQCIKWGNDYKWNIPYAKPNAKASGANLLTCAQTWLECYMKKKDKKMIAPTIAHFMSTTVKNPLTRPLDWYYEGGDRYVDALFVAPPVLAMLYKITANEKYDQWLDSFFWDVYGSLYDRGINLFYRDIRWSPCYKCGQMPRISSASHQDARATYVYQTTAAGKRVVWSRGNGWAFAGLARILKYLPKDKVNFERYEAVFKKMAKSLIARQQEDGYWRPNLDDPNDYPYKETSGTGFFVYGLAWGINNGYLNEKEYMPAVVKGWKALCEAVSESGKVQWGQLGGGAPFVIKQEDSSEFTTGIFLLAASEVYKMH